LLRSSRQRAAELLKVACRSSPRNDESHGFRGKYGRKNVYTVRADHVFYAEVSCPTYCGLRHPLGAAIEFDPDESRSAHLLVNPVHPNRIVRAS